MGPLILVMRLMKSDLQVNDRPASLETILADREYTSELSPSRNRLKS